jgi:hypothetical protein
MTPKLFGCLVLLSTIPAIAQNTPKSVALTNKSNLPPNEILKAFQKECPSASITSDATKSDYTLEAVRKADPRAGEDSFDLTLFDRDGKTLRTASTPSLGNAVRDVCQAIFIATAGQQPELTAPTKRKKGAVIVEVVDTENLTQSVDARGNGGVVPALTGRRTHTDTSTIRVIINGEHAVLDCYEHRKGCTTMAPGKYYGELDGESVWVDYEMPLTHKPIRNHYKVAGSW